MEEVWCCPDRIAQVFPPRFDPDQGKPLFVAAGPGPCDHARRTRPNGRHHGKRGAPGGEGFLTTGDQPDAQNIGKAQNRLDETNRARAEYRTGKD